MKKTVIFNISTSGSLGSWSHGQEVELDEKIANSFVRHGNARFKDSNEKLPDLAETATIDNSGQTSTNEADGSQVSTTGTEPETATDKGKGKK